MTQPSFRTCARCRKKHNEDKMQEFVLSFEPESYGLFIQKHKGRGESGWLFGTDCAKRVIKAGGKRDW